MGGTPQNAIPAPFPEAISKAPCISWVSCFQGRRNGSTKAPKLSILQYPLLFRRPFPRPLVFLGFPASKAAEMGGTPQKHQNCRFCNTRSFSEAISKAPCIFSISGFQGRRNGSNPTKAPNRGHFQGPSYFLDFQLPRPPKWGACRRPFPTPLGLPGFPASKATEMGGTPQKHQNCRFGNTRSFSGGHLQGPLYFLDFRLPRRPKWGLTPQKHKHCRFCNICLVFLGFSGFQGRRNGREPHKSTKIDDFAIPAPFPVGFLASRAVEMGGTPQKPEAISKALSISWISGFQGQLSILQYLLLFWRPFPRPLGFPGFLASG